MDDDRATSVGGDPQTTSATPRSWTKTDWIVLLVLACWIAAAFLAPLDIKPKTVAPNESVINQVAGSWLVIAAVRLVVVTLAIFVVYSVLASIAHRRVLWKAAGVETNSLPETLAAATALDGADDDASELEAELAEAREQITLLKAMLTQRRQQVLDAFRKQQEIEQRENTGFKS